MTPVEDPDEGAARATRKRRQRRSRGRWIYLAAGALVLAMVVAAWNRLGDGTRQPEVPAGTGPQAPPKPALVPDRPSRDRPERPGEERDRSRRSDRDPAT